MRDNFKKGSVEMLILALLSIEEMYGYQLSKIIAEQSSEMILIPEGSMYPTLYKLVEMGHLKTEKRLVGKRKERSYYMIQSSGRERLYDLEREYYNVHSGVKSILKYVESNTGDEK
jgi:PadR family transcriptional regulator PadR